MFKDPLALSMYDEDHSADEERWVTLGQSEGGLLVVVHTYRALSETGALIRIISARRATKQEQHDYEAGR